MSPSAQRWRPHRAGIIGLYEYADQVFELRGGRLLLRGHNTSGKTKALELLLPFCLDGDISPKKLDPFGAGYKTMWWNVVGCGEDEKRVGYVWLEFERLTAGGELERLTCGIGMRANRSVPGEVPRWYFIARNRRVGIDLQLVRAREPIGRADLTAALGDDGEILDGARAYRARLGDLLFGFAGEEQYQTMLRLMRDLRRPHLSKTLDPARVAEQLAIGLPAIDEELMRKLAGGLEQIETLERGLARLRDVRERLRRFHQRTYAAYARAAVRGRADDLRQAQTIVENAAERLRSTRDELARERTRAVQAADERDAAEGALVRLSAERDALVSSEAWGSVAEVEAIGQLAATQSRAATASRDRADESAAAAAGQEAELIAARAAVDHQRALAADDLAGAEEVGAHAGLSSRIDPLATQLREGSLAARTWGELVHGLLADWRDVTDRHSDLIGAVQRARRAAERARDQERDASERLERAVATKSEAEEQLEAARSGLVAGLLAWHARLAVLDVPGEELEAALDALHDGHAPAAPLAGALDRARNELADRYAELRTLRAGVEQEIADAETEVALLRAAHDDGPAPPAWERSERTDRPGAPLWRLVDFREHLDEGGRAGLEAALEASGLLDAWVTPSGALEDRELADVIAAAGRPLSERSLLGALAPVPDTPVAEGVVKQLLNSLSLGERTGHAWFALDGRFALGPLLGRGTKERAEHIGAAAREARRARRLQILHRQLESLGERLRGHDDELAATRTRRTMLEAEVHSLPDPAPVVSALRALDWAVGRHADAGRLYERACAETRAAADEEVATEAARREHAAAHGLPPGLGESGLGRLREASGELRGQVAITARSWAATQHLARQAETQAMRTSELRSRGVELLLQAQAEEAEAARLTAEHAAREAALGSTGDELRQRYRDVLAELKSARAAESRARQAETEGKVASVRLESEASVRGDEHQSARADREAAGTQFRALGPPGLLRLVLGDRAPEDAARAETWPHTRALEVARALPDELLAARSSAGERGLEVQRQVQLLDRELAEADMGAYAISGADGLLLVHVTESGSDRTLGENLEALAAEIADREQVLTAEERRVFNDALVEEIADHLRGRIHRVRGTVAEMNTVLRRSPTAAGKVVELEWNPIEGDRTGAERDAVRLLRPDVRSLDAQARGALVAFFRAQIEAARREHAWGEETRAMADTLMNAFDYRAWFRFAIWERSGDGRVRLTKQRHAVGSGGEQSVLIHLPLFAAAAALYGDGSAPRLVMLDEALSGIDDETRERVLKATVDFDLDVVMTSHELWGTYGSVPQLAIYQLHRENGVFGVHAIPFLWDGAVLHELEQGELLV